MSNLFKAARGKPRLQDTALILGALGESGYFNYQLVQAEHELSSANKALETDKSEIAIRRMQDAKDRVALYEFLTNAGRGAAGTYFISGAKFQRKNVKPSNVPAETERLNLNKVYRQTAQDEEARVAQTARDQELRRAVLDMMARRQQQEAPMPAATTAPKRKETAPKKKASPPVTGPPPLPGFYGYRGPVQPPEK
jgi:hypothetical protein